MAQRGQTFLAREQAWRCSVCLQLLCSGGVQSLGSAGGGVGGQQHFPDTILGKTISNQHRAVLLLLYVFTPCSHVKVFTPLCSSNSFSILTVLVLRLFPCVPACRRLLFWLKIGALQYAILKTVLSIFSIVLWTNGNFDLSDVSKFFISEKCTHTTWSQKHVVASL